MRCKTSCFNPTLGRNYFRRFWPLPLAVLTSVLLLLLLPVMGRCQDAWGTEQTRLFGVKSEIYGMAGVMTVLMLLAAFLSAVLVFHHLHSRREIQFYHALPLRRRCLFLTSYLCGFGMIAVPFLLGIGLTMIAVAALGMAGAAVALLQLAGAGLAALLVFYSMAVIACCVAGQTFGAVLIYGGMNFAVIITVQGAQSLAAMFMPGLVFGTAFVEWLTPVLRLVRATSLRYTALSDGMSDVVAVNSYGPSGELVPGGFDEPMVLVVYAAVGVLLSVLAGVLYQIRKGEMVGEMTAFPLVRSLCKIFGALVISVGGAYVFLASGLFRRVIPFWAVLVSVLAAGAIGWYAAEMVVRKSFRVFRKRTAASCGILLAVLLCLMLTGELDLFGRVRYVPEPGQVKTATMVYNYGSNNDIEVTPEDAVALHTQTLAHRESLMNNRYNGGYDRLYIHYELQDGGSLTREYLVCREYDEDGERVENVLADWIQELLSRPEYNVQTWFGNLKYGVTEDYFDSASIQAYDWEEEGKFVQIDCDRSEWRGDYLEFSAAEAVAVYEAACRDIQRGNLGPQGFNTSEEALGCIDFWCYNEAYDPSLGTYQQFVERMPSFHAGVELMPGMTETIACLEQMGFTFEMK